MTINIVIGIITLHYHHYQTFVSW